MHYKWIVAVIALVAKSVSAFPSGRRGLVTADVISSPPDDLVKRNYALDTADDKKGDVRQSLFSRFAEASTSSYLHVPISINRHVKRVVYDGDLDDQLVDVDPDDQLVDVDPDDQLVDVDLILHPLPMDDPS